VSVAIFSLIKFYVYSLLSLSLSLFIPLLARIRTHTHRHTNRLVLLPPVINEIILSQFSLNDILFLLFLSTKRLFACQRARDR